MLLITSGAYVDSELYAEFGRIPPAFLPVGNRRLFTYQARRHGARHAQVVMTVPGDFALDEADAACLQASGITLYRTETGASLGWAVHDFLSTHGVTGPIEILYGDTLIDDPPRAGSDWLAVGQTDEYYDWYHEVPRHGQPGGIWTGMFAFSDAARLRELLAEGGDFIASVVAYERQVGLAHWPVAHWLDFGHVHTYFDSKRTVTTQRHFNQLRVSDGVVTKTGDDTGKIAAEAEWFERAPPAIKPFLAPYIGRTDEAGACGYQLEYLHLVTLNELYVFGRLPERVWARIFRAADAFLRTEHAVPLDQPPPLDAIRQAYRDKTLSRLEAYSAATGCDLDADWALNGVRTPSLRVIAEQASAAVEAGTPEPSFLHGDFCFSNILFDFRAGRVKTIDPRGTDASGRPSRFGDLRYDIGKLAHSVLGLYDHIVAGHFMLEEEEDPLEDEQLHNQLHKRLHEQALQRPGCRMGGPSGERLGMQMSSPGSAQFSEQGNMQLSGGLDGQTELPWQGATPSGRLRPGHALRFRVLAQRTGPIRELFLSTPFAGRLPTAWDCYPVMVLLFLSMLPLHADAPQRQRALLANAIRVYLEWRAHDRDSDGGNEPPLL
ncbi:phosphotransferase [Massilia sp. BSC265]|uniref:phosphotransferase n=1 Tax=Massilia sp. BSC265 TaxID=1549812 RepID=UPI0006914B4A|nr:phosphotransferase [Massilia sp. BSC265]